MTAPILRQRVRNDIIVCTKHTKEHESILVTDAKAIHLHTALLLLGAKLCTPGGVSKSAMANKRAGSTSRPPCPS